MSGIVFFCLLLVLVPLRGISGEISFSFNRLLLVPVGLYVGVLSCVLIHNASHGASRPLWLNRFVGEICAAFQLYGFLGESCAHDAPHLPDDPVRDPHPPAGLTYWAYLRGMQASLVKCTDQFYFEQFGRSEEILAIVKQRGTTAAGCRRSTPSILVRVFGAECFCFFYIPAYAAVFFFFTHFNYITHRPRNDGSVEILDIDDGLYYKIMNRIAAGTYFHKTHHLKPKVFDPRRAL